MGGTDISVTNAFLTALCPGIVVLDAFTRSHIENRNKKMGESHYDNSGESGSNDRKGGMFNYTPEVEAFLNEDGIRSIDIIQYAFTQCVNCTQMSKRWSVGDDGSNTSNSDTAERYRAYMIPSLSENIIKQVADWMDKHLLIMFENNTRKEERWGLGGDRKEGVVTEEKDKDGLFKVTKDIWKNIYDAGDSDHQSLGNQKKAYVVVRALCVYRM